MELKNVERFNDLSMLIKNKLANRLKELYGWLDVGVLETDFYNTLVNNAIKEAEYMLTRVAIACDISLLSSYYEHQSKALSHIVSNEGGY